MSHTYAMSVRSPMSGIAVINHSDCKKLYAWVTHRHSHRHAIAIGIAIGSIIAMFDLRLRRKS